MKYYWYALIRAIIYIHSLIHMEHKGFLRVDIMVIHIIARSTIIILSYVGELLMIFVKYIIVNTGLIGKK